MFKHVEWLGVGFIKIIIRIFRFEYGQIIFYILSIF